MIRTTYRRESGYSLVYPLLASGGPPHYSEARRVEVLAKPFLALNVLAILLLVAFRDVEVVVDDVGLGLAVYAFVRRHATAKHAPEGEMLGAEVAPAVVILDYTTFALAFALFFLEVGFFVSRFLAVFAGLLAFTFAIVAALPLLNVWSFRRGIAGRS